MFSCVQVTTSTTWTKAFSPQRNLIHSTTIITLTTTSQANRSQPPRATSTTTRTSPSSGAWIRAPPLARKRPPRHQMWTPLPKKPRRPLTTKLRRPYLMERRAKTWKQNQNLGRGADDFDDNLPVPLQSAPPPITNIPNSFNHIYITNANVS